MSTALLPLPVPDRAITVRQPWGSAIIAGIKRVENRSWAPSQPLPVWLWLHAAGAPDHTAWPRIAALWPGVPADLPYSAILGAIRIDAIGGASDDPWFVGPLAWRIGALWRLPTPVRCSGQLGLWRPGAEVQAAAAAQA